MLNNRYVGHSIVCTHDIEKLIEDLTDKLDRDGLVTTYKEKCKVRDAIEDTLNEYTLYRSSDHSKTGVVGWRLLYMLLFLFQWILWPYCFLKWLRTGNFRLNSNSQLSIIIDRIIERSN